MKPNTLPRTQKAELLRTMSRDLKVEVSLLRRGDYERELRDAPSLGGITAIERNVRTDPRLSQWDRIRLLSMISRATRRGLSEVGVD